VLGRSTKARDVGLLLVLVGLSSTVFGVEYGSYFGITTWGDGENERILALWEEPLHAPLELMGVTIAFGIALVSFGVVLNVINLLRRGDLVTALLDKFGVAGALFYWSALAVGAIAFKYTTLLESTGAAAIVLLVVGFPLLCVALKEPVQYALCVRAGKKPHSDSFLMAVMESVIEAFEAVLSYLSNTISFVRIAAYAMSHAAILMATVLMAQEMYKIPHIGGLLYIGTLVVGNAIAFLLEGIIVAVQALRLEYYEFFGKFFTQTGLAFEPFSFGEKPGTKAT
jgi:V/A-type H+-transporting ATPase subunit I